MTALIVFAIFMGVAAGTAYWLLKDSAKVFPVREGIFRKDGLWYWRLISRSGETLVESSHGYEHAHHARQAVTFTKTVCGA